MRVTRLRKRFRYENDPEEVTLYLSIREARTISDSCRASAAEEPDRLGIELQEFLDASEDTDAQVINMDRHE